VEAWKFLEISNFSIRLRISSNARFAPSLGMVRWKALNHSCLDFSTVGPLFQIDVGFVLSLLSGKALDPPSECNFEFNASTAGKDTVDRCIFVDRNPAVGKRTNQHASRIFFSCEGVICDAIRNPTRHTSEIGVGQVFIHIQSDSNRISNSQ
jgi:hypothetical protein